MLRYCLIFTLFISLKSFSQPVLQLVEYASGFTEPVAIANAGDERLFIVERPGYIRIIDATGEVLPTEFLDIHDQVESGYSEQGLLGLAFHPDYAANGYFFVYYTDVDGNTMVSRFTRSAFDDNIADPTTEEPIYTAVQPFVNHNGGCIQFGPDGYLYIGLGDGGSSGDPGNRAQNPENQLGKMHRIDVNGALPFTVPADNPFFGAVDTLPEIWAIGLRNPWRWSFDRLTGDLWIGDVGQNLYEEVDFEPAGSGGGVNYGWRCYEASDEYNETDCAGIETYTFPIFEYPHDFATGGYALSGGYVYRGTQFPGMYGYYLCADFLSGNWWWIYPDGAGGWMNDRIDAFQIDISTFGEDVYGELYCAELYTGQIFHVTDACGEFVITATATDFICGVQDSEIDLTITAGAPPYLIEWSTGSADEDIVVDAAGVYTVTVTDSAGCERILNVIVNEAPAFTPGISFDEIVNELSTDMGVAWQWYLNDIAIDGATEMTYIANEDGNYKVLVTDANGCSVMSASLDIIVSSIGEFSDRINAVEIYPNPAAEFITIQLSTDGIISDLTLEISDLVGSVVFEKSIGNFSGDLNMQVQTKDLSPGIYNIHLFGNNDNWSGSLIISR